jgi:class 3 adenylate cyclase
VSRATAAPWGPDALITAHGGQRGRERREGDSLFAGFAHAAEAVGAALSMARVVLAEPWPSDPPLRVRRGLHTGSAQLRAGDCLARSLRAAPGIR